MLLLILVIILILWSKSRLQRGKQRLICKLLKSEVRDTKIPQKFYFQRIVHQLIRNMEELVECQQKQGHYPFQCFDTCGNN